MSNSESIPVDTRDIIEDGLHLNDNSKNAVGRLWRLYLRVNIENAERVLQDFLNSLQQYIGQPETMLNVINQKIVDVQREINGNVFNGGVGIKKRKTGKKRKRTTRKTTKKRSNKRRKTIKGGKDLTTLYLNKNFPLYDENTSRNQEIQRRAQEAEQRRRQEEIRRIQEEEERRRQEEAERRRQEEQDRIQRERDFWARF